MQNTSVRHACIKTNSLFAQDPSSESTSRVSIRSSMVTNTPGFRASNKKADSLACAVRCDWDKLDEDSSGIEVKSVDVIIGSDVICEESD